MINSDEKILIEAGLSEEQSAIYATLLDKGPLKAAAISSWNGIKKGLVYKVLEQLETMGLVSKKGGEGSVAVFSPNSPDRLRQIMEQKEKSFALSKEIILSSVGNLSSKFNLLSGKPNVQFFEGTDAIEKITGDYPTNENEIRQYIDIGTALENMGEKTVSYLKERVKRNISKRMILSDSVENRDYAKKGSPLTEFRIIKKELPTVIQAYDNKVTMLTLTKEKQIGLMIEDQAVALTLKNLFDELWESAERIPSDSGK